MNNELSNIIRHCFDKSNIEEVDLAEVQKLTDQYPYFAAGHVLFSRYLLLKEDERADAQLQRTALILNNPLWLDHLVSSAGVSEPIHFADTTPAAGYNSAPEEIQSFAPQEDVLVDEPAEEFLEDGDAASEDQFVSSKIEQSDEVSGFQHEITDTESDDEIEPEILPDTESFFVQETVVEPVADNNTFGIDHTDTPIEIQTDDPMPSERSIEQEEGSVPVAIVEEPNEVDHHDQSTESAETKASQHQELSNNDTGTEEQPLAFEAFHTVDYFASQGIKLQQSEFGQDKLGKQLRSFTEWLRSMKRLPASEVPQSDEISINRIAEHSIEDKEVLTEAMAEVWAKQGNREKASAIYRKLSLQNPSKSSYFAAKIQQLNSF